MLEGVQEVIDKFKERVIKEAQQNLQRKKKNVTGKLYNSLDARVKESKNSIELTFGMEEHGWYQDLGVSGRRQVRSNTPFSYKTKFPPRGAIDKWVVQKGIFNNQIRDKKGRFIKRKSLTYLIQRKIFNKGIAPSYFFTKPFEKYIKRLPKDVLDAYGLEFEKLIGQTIEENFKRYMK